MFGNSKKLSHVATEGGKSHCVKNINGISLLFTMFKLALREISSDRFVSSVVHSSINES